MRRKILIKLLLILLVCLNLLSACNVEPLIKNTYSEKQNYFINDYNSSNTTNGNYLTYDEKYIYYISNKDGKIYKISLNGQNKELLLNIEAERLILYNDKIYFIKIKMEGKRKITDEICSVDKTGNNLKTILKADDILNFNICNDIIYYNASSNKTSDGIIPYEIHNLYSYSLNTNENLIIYEDISSNIMSTGIHPIVISNSNLYFNALEDGAYIFMNYKLSENSVQSLLDKNAITDGNSIYFYTTYDNEKNLVKLCKLKINDDINNAKDIFLANENISIKRIAFNEKYLFLMYTETNEVEDGVKINILRINHDTNIVNKIAEYDTFDTSSYFYEYMFIVKDKLIVFNYNIDKEPTIKVLDFEGKLLDWDM